MLPLPEHCSVPWASIISIMDWPVDAKLIRTGGQSANDPTFCTNVHRCVPLTLIRMILLVVSGARHVPLGVEMILEKINEMYWSEFARSRDKSVEVVSFWWSGGRFCLVTAFIRVCCWLAVIYDCEWSLQRPFREVEDVGRYRRIKLIEEGDWLIWGVSHVDFKEDGNEVRNSRVVI
jgi:hypothetical protein